jgi:glutamate---cysteine ligase / carboxylate-amine ligase
VETSIDPAALHHYLSWHSIVPAPRTILAGVAKLPPATVRVIEATGGSRDRLYWQPEYTSRGWNGPGWDEPVPDEDFNTTGKDGSMRTFGVEEELLLVDASTLEPLPAGDWVADLHADTAAGGHQVTAELQQEQIEVANPPQTTLAGQLVAIQTGRALAEQAAARVGGRVVALPTAPGPLMPHLVPEPRYRRIAEQFGLTAAEQLTNGFHIHVGIDAPEEGVAALDRVRVWLPTLLALSANSPFWHGTDTGYASYRYQAWSRWPTAGPTEVFGSVQAYDRHRQALLDTQVPLDAGMLYFDARLSEHHPTLEVRVADVCLDATDAAVIAALTRALVETATRDIPRIAAPDVSASLLKAWSWQASRSGVEGRLIDPPTGEPAPAGDVVARMLDHLRPVLTEYGEDDPVEAVVADILRRGTGARHQRQARDAGHDSRDVVAAALEATHHASALPSSGNRSESKDATGALPAHKTTSSEPVVGASTTT